MSQESKQRNHKVEKIGDNGKMASSGEKIADREKISDNGKITSSGEKMADREKMTVGLGIRHEVAASSKWENANANVEFRNKLAMMKNPKEVAAVFDRLTNADNRDVTMQAFALLMQFQPEIVTKACEGRNPERAALFQRIADERKTSFQTISDIFLTILNVSEVNWIESFLAGKGDLGFMPSAGSASDKFADTNYAKVCHNGTKQCIINSRPDAQNLSAHEYKATIKAPNMERFSDFVRLFADRIQLCVDFTQYQNFWEYLIHYDGFPQKVVDTIFYYPILGVETFTPRAIAETIMLNARSQFSRQLCLKSSSRVTMTRPRVLFSWLLSPSWSHMGVLSDKMIPGKDAFFCTESFRSLLRLSRISLEKIVTYQRYDRSSGIVIDLAAGYNCRTCNSANYYAVSIGESGRTVFECVCNSERSNLSYISMRRAVNMLYSTLINSRDVTGHLITLIDQEKVRHGMAKNRKPEKFESSDKIAEFIYQATIHNFTQIDRILFTKAEKNFWHLICGGLEHQNSVFGSFLIKHEVYDPRLLPTIKSFFEV